jgi:hypothetical protein
MPSATLPFSEVLAVAGFSGVVSSALTAFVAPQLQQYFWKRQRHLAVCLSLIQDLSHKLVMFENQFFVKVKVRPESLERRDEAMDTLLSLMSLVEQTLYLFGSKSSPEMNSFLDLLSSINDTLSNTEAEISGPNVPDYLTAKTRLLTVLYEEIGMNANQFPHAKIRRFSNRFVRIWPTRE